MYFLYLYLIIQSFHNFSLTMLTHKNTHIKFINKNVKIHIVIRYTCTFTKIDCLLSHKTKLIHVKGRNHVLYILDTVELRHKSTPRR